MADDGEVTTDYRGQVTARQRTRRRTSAAPAGVDIPLSQQELAVLLLLAEGLSDAAIADLRGVVARTVESHCRSLLRKTRCLNRVELTRYALARGLVPTAWLPTGQRGRLVTAVDTDGRNAPDAPSGQGEGRLNLERREVKK